MRADRALLMRVNRSFGATEALWHRDLLCVSS
jgi:hypothetical protein